MECAGPADLTPAAIELEYEPRKQFLPFHRRRQRWSILVCHRRAGKTVSTLNDLIKRASRAARPESRYAFIAPQRNQVKDIAWSYLKRYAGPLLAKAPNESELRVDLINGARIRLYGADNPDALRGGYLDGVVLDEFAQHDPALWPQVVRPMLADREGWGIFVGTPKGKNAFWHRWQAAKKDPRWFHMMLKASESRLLRPAEIADMRLEMSPDEYEQEMECSFEAAIVGAYYGKEMRFMLAEGRLRPIEIDPLVRVHTSWDLGLSDSTAIAFWQCVGRERRIVDYYEASGVGLDHYVEKLADLRRQHGWTYGQHFFPHDVQVRELTTGKSRRETLASLGIECEVVPQHNILDGINAVRPMLNRTFIDPIRCDRLVQCLREYRKEWDERLKDWKANPLHDWTSHGADAVRYFAAGFDDSAKFQVKEKGGSTAPQASGWAA